MAQEDPNYYRDTKSSQIDQKSVKVNAPPSGPPPMPGPGRGGGVSYGTDADTLYSLANIADTGSSGPGKAPPKPTPGSTLRAQADKASGR